MAWSGLLNPVDTHPVFLEIDLGFVVIGITYLTVPIWRLDAFLWRSGMIGPAVQFHSSGPEFPGMLA